MNEQAIYNEKIADDPRLIELCLNCTQDNCEGFCEAYRAKCRELLGLPPIVPKPKPVKAHSVMIEPRDGKYQAFGEWHSMSEWARRYGLTRRALRHRIESGRMTMEQALLQPLRPVGRASEKYLVNGVRMTVKEIVQKSGLAQSTVYYRLSKGLPFPEVTNDQL